MKSALGLSLLGLVAACGDGFSLIAHDAGGADADLCPSQVPAQIVYFNQEQGLYKPSDLEDSASNLSTLLFQESIVLRWPHTVNEFSAFYQMCRTRLEAFNLETTIQDPGDVNHIEIMLGDSLPALKETAVYSAVPHDCVRYRRPIAFIDAQLLGPDPDRLCDETLRLIGLTTGLDVTFDPTDAMAKQGSLGRTYADRDMPCGDSSAQPQCFCTGEPTQNSFQRMIEAYGSRCPEQ